MTLVINSLVSRAKIGFHLSSPFDIRHPYVELREQNSDIFCCLTPLYRFYFVEVLHSNISQNDLGRFEHQDLPWSVQRYDYKF